MVSSGHVDDGAIPGTARRAEIREPLTPAAPPPPARRRSLAYALAVFVSSALLLVLEIVAGRLIAPYAGMSLYTWTAIIGVILAGLSLGNWWGGVWADRGAGEAAAGVTLAAGGIACLAILPVLLQVAPLIQGSALDLLSASLLFVLALFFVPAVLLGIVTPLLTTLALRLDPRSGRVVGRMHALAALGSIAGTFLAGFWLVQSFGTRNTLVGSGVALLLLAVPFLLRRPRYLAGAAGTAAVLFLVAHLQQAFDNPCDTESGYYCIRVVDRSEMAPYGEARAMVIDHLIHGVNHGEAPELLLSSYVQLMAEVVLQYHRPGRARSYFFAGGGAYTLPRGITALEPNAEVVVAELDPAVTATAVEGMYLDPGSMSILHEDARLALSRFAPQRFDVVVADAFHDISMPYHLATREYAALVKSRLRGEGVYLLNVLDLFPNPQLVKSLFKTLQSEFRHVSVWLDGLPPEAMHGPVRQTFVLVASDHLALPDTIHASRGLPRSWVKINAPLLQSGTRLSALPVLTDDYVPVERLVSSLLFSAYGR